MSTLCVSTLCVSTLCVSALCVSALCVSTLCVSTLCVSTLCVSTLCLSTLCLSTLRVSTMCEHSMCEHSMSEHHRISPDITHYRHHTLQAERREHREEVLGPSSWAGWLTTPHHTSHIHIAAHQASQAESTKKHEFYCENRLKSTIFNTKNHT